LFNYLALKDKRTSMPLRKSREGKEGGREANYCLKQFVWLKPYGLSYYESVVLMSMFSPLGNLPKYLYSYTD